MKKKMKFKTIILMAILLLLYHFNGILWARPTTAYEAENVVAGWLEINDTPLGTILGSQVANVETYFDDDGEPVYYIVYLQPSGFVIVPADDLVEPIVGFAERGRYDPSVDNPLGALVSQDLNGRVLAVRNTLALETSGAMTSALRSQCKWDRLGDLGKSGGLVKMGLGSISDVRVEPLVQSRWGQTTCCSDPNLACYNYYTPPYAANNPCNYPCGCVATAMAQVMRYHEYPALGIGVNPRTISVDGIPQTAFTRGGDGIGGPYNWDLMVYEPNCSTMPLERQAIGHLCYDAGVASGMSYWQTRSSTTLANAKNALKSIFTYSNAICVSTTGVNIGIGLTAMINPNLDYSHPVILGIFPGTSDGHAVITDGYGYDLGTLYHHLNMGWEGEQDAWYNFIGVMPQNFTVVDGCLYNLFVTGEDELISGRVTDAYSNTLTGETVEAERSGGGTYQAVTDNRGIYVLAHVPSGSTYTVSVANEDYSFSEQVVNTGTSTDGAIVSGNVWGVDFAPFGTDTIYVDTTAAGNDDGTNWTDAFNYLQDALAAASSGDTILVAEGMCKPDQGGGQTPGSRTATFQLISGVAIYGGFPEGGGNSWEDRDVTANETILSGDIGVPDVNTDNSYHVVTGSGTDATAVLDGFTITDGYADGGGAEDNGGGMYNVTGGPTVENCTFSDNSADQYGAGMYNGVSSPKVNNCTFSGNEAVGGGGGMMNNGSSPTVTNCTFRGNAALTNYKGGGMYNMSSCSPIVTNCTFNNNTAGKGGGMANRSSSDPSVTNCTFNGNQTIHNGGGMFNENNCNPTLTNCTIIANTSNYGGGISNFDNSDPIIANCILWDNTATGGAQIYNHDATCSATVTYSDVEGDWPGAGNFDADPVFIDANGPDNIVGTGDDNLHLSHGSPCIDIGNNSVVANNLDIENRLRLVDGDCNGTVTVDMGAYEFAWVYIGDLDGDCDVDFGDFAVFANHWLQSIAP